jgi:hypothetical protein
MRIITIQIIVVGSFDFDSWSSGVMFVLAIGFRLSSIDDPLLNYGNMALLCHQGHVVAMSTVSSDCELDSQFEQEKWTPNGFASPRWNRIVRNQLLKAGKASLRSSECRFDSRSILRDGRDSIED